jgi:hypothetical protein
MFSLKDRADLIDQSPMAINNLNFTGGWKVVDLLLLFQLSSVLSINSWKIHDFGVSA